MAAKVFYHLGELDDALTYALGAGLHFDVASPNEFEQTLLSKCMDQYIALRVRQADGPADEPVEIDARLVSIVERMFDRCFSDRQFEHAVGIALESRRLDRLEDAVNKSGAPARMLDYTVSAAMTVVMPQAFRLEVIRMAERLHRAQPEVDHVALCRCHLQLDLPDETGQVLHDLLNGGEDDHLVAYQVAFDLFSAQAPHFSRAVADYIEGIEEAVRESGVDAEMDAETKASNAEYLELHRRLVSVLDGTRPVQLRLDFLSKRNKADPQVLKNIRAAVESRTWNSVVHSATVVANAFMHAGTGADTFLRENIDWLEKATNWSRFSAAASLGVIYQGMADRAQRKLSPYLPSAAGGTGRQPLSPYTEGGAYYAMGLLNVHTGAQAREFLKAALGRSGGNETKQHGACLGMGLADMGTGDEAVLEDLKAVLYSDNAVAGEAAGVALGLVLLGSGHEQAAEMLSYARVTQHEKIVRGLGLGLALTMFGREGAADAMVEQMTRDQDPIIRYAGMQVLGLAYAGTTNAAAIQRLLHFGVKDVSLDVRRAAIMNLGFVLCLSPERAPQVVGLLAESFNPHSRYGAAMAVGIACAGTGSREAQKLLEPLWKDPVDFVRQGARVATSLVLLQQPEARVKDFRGHLSASVSNRHEEPMGKMGAVMAAGILDAGGRNVTVSLRSPLGGLRRTSVVGLACFTQHWFWHPMAHMLSLAFVPTSVTGLTANLRAPEALHLDCHCKPTTFAYPPPVSDSKSDSQVKLPTAKLSVTNKARRQAARKGKAAGGGAMDVDGDDAKAPAAGTSGRDGDGMDVDAVAPDAGDEPAPTSFSLQNMSRVVPSQARYVAFPAGSRYVPVRRGPVEGVVMLRDTRKGEEGEVAYLDQDPAPPPAPAAAPANAAYLTPQPGTAADGAGQAEPAPPDAFEYDDDN